MAAYRQGFLPALADEFRADAVSKELASLVLGRGGEAEGQLFVLDPASGKKLRELTPKHEYGITDLAFHPDGQHLASSGRDTLVRIWDPAAGKLVKENLQVAKEFVLDPRRPELRDVSDLQAGEGAILAGPGPLGRTAVHRDDDGRVHAVSGRCTHLGCTVRFNDAERSWDCPCHGSRFGIDGSVLAGPAVAPLEHRDV